MWAIVKPKFQAPVLDSIAPTMLKVIIAARAFSRYEYSICDCYTKTNARDKNQPRHAKTITNKGNYKQKYANREPFEIACS
jgi:hypothetical protein